jgi:putative aldouronate transport system substrate-binding protein
MLKSTARPRKCIAMLLCMAMLLAILCACASNTTSPAGNSAAPGASSTVEPSAPAEAPYGLTIAYFSQPGAKLDQGKVYDKVNEILLRDCNVKIDNVINLTFSSYFDQINLMLNSSEKLDAFSCNSAYFPTYVNNGQLMALDDLLETYGKDIITVIGRDYLNAGIANGHQYGLTTNRDLAQNQGFLVNVDMCESNGIDYKSIKTLDDFAQALQTIKEKQPDIQPFAPTANIFGRASSSIYALAIGVDPLGDFLGSLMNYGQDEKLTVVNYFATPEYKAMLEFFRGWFEKGYISESSLTETENLFKAGRAFCEESMLKPGIENERSLAYGFKVASVPVTKVFTYTTLVQSWQWAVPSYCADGVAAMKFLNKMYGDPEVTNLMVWGIEGQHYAFTSDGHITYPEGVTAENCGYITGAGWEFGNQYNNYIWEGDSLTLYGDLKAFNDGALKSKAMGFVFDPTKVKTEYAACTAATKQYQAALEMGVMDPETGLPEFLDKLNSAGLDKIIAEKQSQLDAWVAAKAAN